ncbi:hypothetical protein GCM10009838_51090 [Catenulispora subtropica]|uniref:Uncharacterized protein n=1 Tax=Catenulispora subtropica TaxID=450798 RepID=A0ABN2SAW7_9ACTN
MRQRAERDLGGRPRGGDPDAAPPGPLGDLHALLGEARLAHSGRTADEDEGRAALGERVLEPGKFPVPGRQRPPVRYMCQTPHVYGD